MSKKEQSINFQNFPSHEHKEIRSIIKAPENHYLVEIDQSALEARGIAINSKDESFCADIWSGVDTHMYWAKKVVEYYPKILCGKDITEFRSSIKNILVFPAFYGSSQGAIAHDFERKYCEIPRRIMDNIYAEFWETYKGVKEWQEYLTEFYNTHGYVESLTGRRRREPLKVNQIINFPIQSFCSYDICACSGDRLSIAAYRLNKPQYQYRLNVHDSLAFYFHEDTFEDDIVFVCKEMVNPVYDFINVPLQVEVAIGKNWGELDKVCKFATTDWWEYTKEGWKEK